MADEIKPFKLEASEFRFADSDVLHGLGFLTDLAGTWMGHGMNLIARPAFHYKALNGGTQPNLFLQINFTQEHLKFTPIGSNVPNRGFLEGQDDVILHGLSYLQQISDAASPGIGAMHIEPGFWMRESPKEVNPNDTPPSGTEVVTRMGSIPHGTALLAQGIAAPFTGTPVLTVGSAVYNGSLFPSFNSTPFAVQPLPAAPPGAPPLVAAFHAATTSVQQLAINNPGVPLPFPQYTLTNPLSNSDPGSRPVGLTQEQINDPIVVLQDAVHQKIKEGYIFDGGISLNICTDPNVQFDQKPNDILTNPQQLTGVTPSSLFNGGAQNTVFLADRQPKAPPSGNAPTQTVYATFWIEKLRHKDSGHTMLQLQYAQMVTLNFPLPGGAPNLGWPHISVGTLHKIFA